MLFIMHMKTKEMAKQISSTTSEPSDQRLSHSLYCIPFSPNVLFGCHFPNFTTGCLIDLQKMKQFAVIYSPPNQWKILILKIS